jgi:catalase
MDNKPESNNKIDQLSSFKENSQNEFLTTDSGVRINDDQNSLTAGDRGPTLMEDFHFREKMTHFDHENIPERVVHARGSAAHGYFELTHSMSKYTKAKFLQTPGTRTPVFARFSTVVGSRGSTDLARDVRGFSVKFYTEEGNYDLVSNNIPVFFIQDAVKFPDLVHSIKPEPDNEVPQASAAHDTFWDFISLMPESMHMIMWVMSDRAIPRSYRMMEGFGVHTFRFINDKNESFFVKFHWKPKLGIHSVTWDEAQKISGKDPDFHRKDLWEAIEKGQYPEWEFGVQIIDEKDEHKFDFDLLDATKLIPEEEVPVQIIGKMVLNRNPDNFFAETEQVAFHPGHVVSGIDFTNDPLLQGRLFSYKDTQLIRLGGPNFQEIPINRPVAPVHNNQRNGYMRQTINQGKASYHPNTIGGGCPFQAAMNDGGYVHHMEKVDGKKIQNRSESFRDHFSQAKLFYQSQTAYEQKHIQDALKFELGKVEREYIRERMVGLLSYVDEELAEKVADGLGLDFPIKVEKPLNHSIPADGKQEDYEPIKVKPKTKKSEALSMANTVKKSIATRKIAFLATDGVDDSDLMAMKKALIGENAEVKIVSTRSGHLKSKSGDKIKIDESFLTTDSVLFDAVYLPGGSASIEKLTKFPDAIQFIDQAYKHCKPIASSKDGVDLISQTAMSVQLKNQNASLDDPMNGVLVNRKAEEFIQAIAHHRFWDRESKGLVPA